MRSYRLLVVAWLAAGCAAFDRQPAPVSTLAPARTSATELVAYLAKLKAMSDSALTAESARQRQAAQRDPSDVEKLKVAIALALTPQSEEGDVLAVVDPLAKRDGSADADVRAMASFLQGMVHERRRLRESAAAAGAKLRDERRAR